MREFLKIISAIAGAVTGFTASLPAAAAIPMGDPPMTRMVPQLDAYPMNFDTAQDAQGVIYVANYDGVMIFDGARWSLLELPNRDLARVVIFDGRDRVYVGGYGVFGYIQRDAAGQEQFHDLTLRYQALLDDEIVPNVWRINVFAYGVLFQTDTQLFLYQPESDTIELWRHEKKYGDMAEFQGEPVVQFRGEGLKRLRDGLWQLLPGSEPLSEHIYFLVSMPGSSLLAIPAAGQVREYRAGQVQDVKIPPGFPAVELIASVLTMPDGTLAIAGLDGILYIVDLAASTVHQFRVDVSTLAGLAPARDGGLLSSGDEAIYHIGWPSAWTGIGHAQGLNGGIQRIRRWGSRWFAMTYSGVIEILPGGCRKVTWTDEEAWDLLDLGDGSALFADRSAIRHFQGGRETDLTRKSSFTPVALRRSVFDPGIVYVATDHGIAVLQRAAGGFQLRLDPSGEHLEVRDVVEAAPRELWVGTSRDELHWLRLSEDYQRVEERRRIGAEQGLKFGKVAETSANRLPDGTILVSTRAGLFRWQDGRFVAEDHGGLNALRGEEELLTLHFSPQGQEWATSERHVFNRTAKGLWQRLELADILRGAVTDLNFDQDGRALIGTSSMVLRQDFVLRKQEASSPQVQLRQVELSRDGTQTERLALRAATMPVLAQDEKLSLSFQFALPEYRRRDDIRYQARLKGFNENFSEWSAANTYTYRRLEAGDYQFEVHARDASGRVSEITPYSFTVEPAWYGRLWGQVLLVCMGLALLALMNTAVLRYRTSRLRAEKERLEGIVAQHTEELRNANRQLQDLAHLDPLTQIANRRRLDSYLQECWQRCADQGRPLSVLALDGDGLKQFNDREGHHAGDQLLKQVAAILSGCLRRSEDLIARYGGDEFIVVLPGAALITALHIAEHMRDRIESAKLPITVSIGVVTHAPPVLEMDPNSAFAAADAAMYEAKRRGRNRVVAHNELVPAERVKAS